MTFPPPSQDPFYAAVPAAPPPGHVVRHRRVPGDLVGGADVLQVIYGSTGARRQAIAVAGTIIVPSMPWRGAGPRPILSYGVGVHGLGRDAAPSHWMVAGAEAELPLILEALDRGWAVVVTDGEGLGMPGPHTYGAGRPGGHAMLDMVRAAMRTVPELSSDAPVIVWGYSEGGRCAAFAAELQPDYAPELELRAVAAGGVPADLHAVAKAIDGGPYSGLGLAVLVGLAHAHARPELSEILSSRGLRAARNASDLDVVGLIVSHPEPMRHHTVRDEPWDEPMWRSLLRLEENGHRLPRAPIHLYHAIADDIVPFEVGVWLRDAYQSLGAEVTWSVIDAPDHLTGATLGARTALDWLDAMLVAHPSSSVRACYLHGTSAEASPGRAVVT